jgi:hypothetical protein
MPRHIEMVVPPQRTDAVLKEVERMDGVLGVRLSKGVSLRPPGDLVTVLTTNTALHPLLRLIDKIGIGHDPGASITTMEPTGVILPSHPEAVSRDSTDIPWEEMEFSMARESNMNPNALFVMFVAGLIAAVGTATGALHLVIGAMVIAPGFEPIVRVGLGVISRSHSWKHGLRDFGAAYLMLLTGGAAGGLLLTALARSIPVAENTYLQPQSLLTYWTTISGASVMVSLLAGAVGAVLIASNRSVLTAGVMIALALVPSVAIAGMGLVAADLSRVSGGLTRWAVDVGLVLAMSMVVFAIKHRTVHQRPMMGRTADRHGV